jgi:hypothetical protein
MKMLDKKTAGDLDQLRHLHGGHHARDRVAGGHHRQLSFAAEQGLQGRVRRRHRRGQGRRRPRRRREGRRRSRTSQIVDRTRAMVTFSVQDEPRADRATHAAIRYRNLVGQRYISLTQEIGDSARLPTARRSRSPDLAGARPRPCCSTGSSRSSRRSRPADLNKLSYEIVQVFQGEGGTLEGLLRTPPR